VRIHYGVNACRQGHLCRSAEMVRRLRARGHRVSVTTSGPPPPGYARGLLGAFEHLDGPGLPLRDGRLDLVATAGEIFATLPRRVGHAASLARRLVRERVELVISDFDPITAWASRLAGVPSVGVAGNYRVTRTDGPAPRAPALRAAAVVAIEASALGLSRVFALSFSPARPTRADTEVVGPIVDAELRAAAGSPRANDVTLVYVTAPRAAVIAALRPSGARFRVYGGERAERVGAIELVATDRRAFLDDLLGCRAVILNGGFQGVCEAAVLGKPILTVPVSGQYEALYNAHQVTAAGLGISAATLDPVAVARLLAMPAPPAPRFVDGGDQVIARLGL
jgi:uncharacterized protein (TIGR00661 family)